jgi:translocation and assembly module TamA
MPAYEAQMSKGRTPRRALSRALLFALACSAVLVAESGSAAAFEIFGIKLWGSSNDEDADIVDPLRYSVSIEAPDADKTLVKKLENASSLKSDEDRPVSGSLGLLAKARSDREQLVAAEGVLLLPGTVYDEPGHVRVGFGRVAMPEALERLERFIDTRS